MLSMAAWSAAKGIFLSAMGVRGVGRKKPANQMQRSRKQKWDAKKTLWLVVRRRGYPETKEGHGQRAMIEPQWRIAGARHGWEG